MFELLRLFFSRLHWTVIRMVSKTVGCYKLKFKSVRFYIKIETSTAILLTVVLPQTVFAEGALQTGTS